MGLGVKKFFETVKNNFKDSVFEFNDEFIDSFRNFYIAFDANIIIHAVFPPKNEDIDFNELPSKIANSSFYMIKNILHNLINSSRIDYLHIALVYDSNCPIVKQETILSRKKTELKRKFFDSQQNLQNSRSLLQNLLFDYVSSRKRINSFVTTIVMPSTEGEMACIKYLCSKRDENIYNKTEKTLYAIATVDTDLYPYVLLDSYNLFQNCFNQIQILHVKCFYEKNSQKRKLSELYSSNVSQSDDCFAKEEKKRVVFNLSSIVKQIVDELNRQNLEENFQFVKLYVFCLIGLVGNDFLPSIIGNNISFLDVHKIIIECIKIISKQTQFTEIVFDKCFATESFLFVINRAAENKILKQKTSVKWKEYEKQSGEKIHFNIIVTQWIYHIYKIFGYLESSYSENSEQLQINQLEESSLIKSAFTNDVWKSVICQIKKTEKLKYDF